MYYIICSCPRSGSSLLAEALGAMKVGKPEEYFNPVTMGGNSLGARKNFMQPTPEAYIEHIKQEYTLNGIFGIKIHYAQLCRYFTSENQIMDFFPGAKFISITRRNILRQAISAARAERTKAWTWQLPQQKNPKFSHFSIIRQLIILAREISLWEEFYVKHEIKPLRILYEDMDGDYENTMQKVILFLGIRGVIPPPPLKKQADTLTDAWVGCFIRAFRERKGVSDIIRFLTERW